MSEFSMTFDRAPGDRAYAVFSSRILPVRIAGCVIKQECKGHHGKYARYYLLQSDSPLSGNFYDEGRAVDQVFSTPEEAAESIKQEALAPWRPQ